MDGLLKRWFFLFIPKWKSWLWFKTESKSLSFTIITFCGQKSMISRPVTQNIWIDLTKVLWKSRVKQWSHSCLVVWWTNQPMTAVEELLILLHHNKRGKNLHHMNYRLNLLHVQLPVYIGKKNGMKQFKHELFITFSMLCITFLTNNNS